MPAVFALRTSVRLLHSYTAPSHAFLEKVELLFLDHGHSSGQARRIQSNTIGPRAQLKHKPLQSKPERISILLA
jgi:hypothetical protein